MSIIKPATPEDVESLRSCLLLVEQKFGMGTHHTWTESSFRILSDHITTASKRTVSTNTLRRLYDKVVEGDGDYLPKVETKNALAIYLGHKDWYHFVTFKPDQGSITPTPESTQQILQDVDPSTLWLDGPILAPDAAHQADISPANETDKERIEIKQFASNTSQQQHTSTAVPQYKSRYLQYGLVLILVLLVGFVFYRYYWFADAPLAAAPTKFARLVRINKVDTSQLPFGLEYRVEYSGYNPDSLFLDFYDGKRGSVTDNANFFSARYFAPGFYSVTLRSHEMILDHDDMVIPSQGWKRFIMTSQSVFDYPESATITEATALSKGELTNLALKLKQELRTHYENIGTVSFPTDDFILTARIKNDLLLNDLDCYSSKLKVLGTDGAFVICFTKPKCARLTWNLFGDVIITGTKLPQENLAIDLTKWRTINLAVRNKVAKVSVDGKVVLTVPYNKEIGKLKGLEFRFEGDGKVEYITVKNSKGEVMHENVFSKTTSN
jgi:hypothetical protein